ncbi:MAG TPA: LCP family protein, partial [Solirubrobacteraceae bacterium]|nr:LCP family protein [Solirubrobacteraceae bacterium]
MIGGGDSPRGSGDPGAEPEGAPEYRVYRSRKPLFRRRAGGDRDELARLRADAGGRPQQPAQPGAEPERKRGRGLIPKSAAGPARKRFTRGRVIRWVLTAIVGWIAISALVFLVSAQVQQGKVSDANHLLGGAGYPAAAANNILVLGSDVRTRENAEPGAQTTGNGRSDSILLIRIGGGANSRMGIARDTVVDIPGAGRQRINAAYSIGGAALAVQTIENYTGIDINHLMIVSFEDFPALIDAMGGITYRGGCVVSRINGGFKNGGYTLRLPAGKSHIDGKQALALARTRKNDCNKNEDDLTRARRQQKIVGAMKRRLLSPMAFARLPLISWNVPKALR